MMSRYLGLLVVRALADDDVTEIYANPQDGGIRFDTRSTGPAETGALSDSHRLEMFLNYVASSIGVTLGVEQSVEAELPGCSFVGVVFRALFLQRSMSGSRRPPFTASMNISPRE
jgi:hypothetical protein